MKNTIRLLFLASLCSFAFSSATQAQTQAQAQSAAHSWYFKADAGGVLTQDTDLKEFFGSVTAGSTVKFDPGIRLGVGAGYFFTDWFALEGEIAVMANNIKSITDAESVDAWYSQAPFLANVRLQCPYDWFVIPYIGGGGGGSVATLDANHIDLNGTHFDGWMSDVVFAYQAFGGLRFRINETMGLSVEYRYFVAEAPSFEADVTVNTDTQHARFGSTHSHVLSLMFDWRF